jgi:hypothetical protein
VALVATALIAAPALASSKSPTTTTISGLSGSVIASQAFSFKATVRAQPPGMGSPTGKVQFAFCLLNQPSCTGSPGGVATLPSPTPAEQAANENMITFSLPSGVLKPGFYRVTVQYIGNSVFHSSTSPTGNILVNKVPTTTAVKTSLNPAMDGGREVLKVLITPDSRATSSEAGPTGMVTFTITGAAGDTLVCATGSTMIPVGTTSTNQGVARCDISGMVHAADSPYSLKAAYSGDSVYVKSSGSGTLDVT